MGFNPTAELQNYKYQFDAEGIQRNSTPNTEIFRDLRGQLAQLYKHIFNAVPKSCECAHEVRLAAKYTKAQWLQLPVTKQNEETLVLLCPKPVRDENPNCAHANVKLKPKPYTDVTRILRKLGILEEQSWENATYWLEHRIGQVDTTIAAARWSLPVLGEEAKVLQKSNVDQLMQMRRTLLFILDTVIRDIDALPSQELSHPGFPPPSDAD